MILNLGASPPRFPILTLTYNGTNYEFAGGADVEVEGAFRLSQDGDVFKAWLYANCSFSFEYLPGTQDFCLVGKGAKGAAGSNNQYGEVGGKGGAGGRVSNFTSQAFALGTTYTVAVSSSGSSFSGGDISQSVGVGGGASGGLPGSITYGGTDINAQNGTNGSYAFGDSTFDGIKYAPGGGGRNPNWTGAHAASAGETTTAPGRGGTGGWSGGSGSSPGVGGDGANGCVLLRITA